MKRFVGMAMVAPLLAWIVIAAGCTEEHAGSLDHRDLGNADTPLVPTGLTLANAAVAKGSAQWQKLREPAFDQETGDQTDTAHPSDHDTPEAASKNVGHAEDISYLRQLIADYNTLVEEKNYDEMVGFFVESQVETAEKLVQVIPALAAKLRELNAALPEPNAELAASVESITLTKLFHLDVDVIKIVSDTSATGELSPSSGGGTLKFVVEEEDWYFEHPMVASAAEALNQLEQGMDTLDQGIAAIKSGSTTGDALDATVGTALDMLIPLTPDTAGDAPEPEDTIGT